jgi:hypothetical protein
MSRKRAVFSIMCEAIIEVSAVSECVHVPHMRMGAVGRQLRAQGKHVG